MSSLRYLNTVLTVLALLLAGQVWLTLTDSDSPVMAQPQAHAQGSANPGAQRAAMIDALNAVQDEVAGLRSDINDGVNVTVENFPESD